MTQDNVNHPSHYTEGRAFEVIDVLEDWIARAPDPVLGGLQWNSLKYQGRVWDKVNPLEDLKKSRWYLNRLIDKLEARQVPFAATYEDVLEDAAHEAAEGKELLAEYGLADIDDQPLPGWDSDDDYMWDPSLGPVELSQEEVDMILRNRDLSDSEPDEVVKVIEKRGFLLGVMANGNTCVLNDRGNCE